MKQEIDQEAKDFYDSEYAKAEAEYPGFLEFLDKLQPGTVIKFNGLKFRSADDPPDHKKDVTIEIMYREEIGTRGRAPGGGCIEYATVKDGKHAKCHEDGFYPCQTFMSMRSWYRASDSHEIL